MESIEISRKYFFSAGENSDHSQWGTGADWEVEVTLQGTVDDKTGLVVNLIDLDEVVNPCLQIVDKKHLNKEVEEFKNQQVTPAKLAEFFFQKVSEYMLKKWPQNKNFKLVQVKASKPLMQLWGIYGQTRFAKSPKGISNS